MLPSASSYVRLSLGFRMTGTFLYTLRAGGATVDLVVAAAVLLLLAGGAVPGKDEAVLP